MTFLTKPLTALTTAFLSFRSLLSCLGMESEASNALFSLPLIAFGQKDLGKEKIRQFSYYPPLPASLGAASPKVC